MTVPTVASPPVTAVAHPRLTERLCQRELNTNTCISNVIYPTRTRLTSSTLANTCQSLTLCKGRRLWLLLLLLSSLKEQRPGLREVM